MENGEQKAHPFINKNGDAEQGLTKREYFAAMTMQGSCANNALYGATADELATKAVGLAYYQILEQYPDNKELFEYARKRFME